MTKIYGASNDTIHCTAGTKNDRRTRQNRTRNPEDGFESCTVHHIKAPKSHGFGAFSLLFKPKKFGISETDIRPNRLYDKNTTVLQKWREKEPSGSLSLLRLYGFQRLSQRVRRCVIIDPFQHSGVAVSKQICNQVLRYALRRPERCSRVPKLMGRQ